MNLRKVLIDLCRKQTEYTETAHLPEHYYTTRYSLHEDKLSDFMSDDKSRKVLDIKFRKEWEYTMKKFISIFSIDWKCLNC